MSKHLPRFALVVAALGLASVGSRPARADSAPLAKGAVVAFWSVRALGVPEKEVARVQKVLVRAAGEAAALGGLELIPPSAVAAAIAKSKESVGLAACDGATACVAEIARKVGATAVVAGEVGGFGGSYVVNVNLITDTGRVTRRDSMVVETGEGLEDEAAELMVRLFVPDHFRGELVLTVDVEGARVYLDGAEVGASPLGEPISATVGKHAVRVNHPAHRDFVRWVEVSYRTKTNVAVALKRYAVLEGDITRTGGPAGAGVATGSGLPWYRRWWAIAVLGVVLTAGAAGLAYGLAKPRYDCIVTIGEDPPRGGCTR